MYPGAGYQVVTKIGVGAPPCMRVGTLEARAPRVEWWFAVAYKALTQNSNGPSVVLD